MNNKRLTTDEFIKRARIVHSNKYDYSLVNYVNFNTKIEIACHEHGSFLQTPGSHLNGNGCKNCAIDERKMKYYQSNYEVR